MEFVAVMTQASLSTQAALGERATAVSSEAGPRTVNSAELLGSSRALRIVHRGAVYTLRLTRLGKLILTK
jgi:hemin uptake protein HemP